MDHPPISGPDLSKPSHLPAMMHYRHHLRSFQFKGRMRHPFRSIHPFHWLPTPARPQYHLIRHAPFHPTRFYHCTMTILLPRSPMNLNVRRHSRRPNWAARICRISMSNRVTPSPFPSPRQMIQCLKYWNWYRNGVTPMIAVEFNGLFAGTPHRTPTTAQLSDPTYAGRIHGNRRPRCVPV